MLELLVARPVVPPTLTDVVVANRMPTQTLTTTTTTAKNTAAFVRLRVLSLDLRWIFYKTLSLLGN